MQVSDILETARADYLNDTALDYLWDADSMLRKINEAQRQACNRANLIYDDSTPAYTRITLVAGQASYPLHPKLTVIENIILNGVIITKKTKENLDTQIPTWRTDSGMLNKEVYAVIKGRTLRFTPIPDATDAGGIVTLETYRLPAEDMMSLSDDPEIPEENHRDLIYWVLHEAYKKTDADTFNQDKSDYFLGRFNEIFGPYVPARVRQHQFENPKSLEFRPAHVTLNDYASTEFERENDF
jgi:hypothetical protein